MPSSTAVEVNPIETASLALSGAEMMEANPYRPWPARITSITQLTDTEKLFEFRFIDERIREAFHHEPGQFVEVSIFGVGEAPISISSSPTPKMDTSTNCPGSWWNALRMRSSTRRNSKSFSVSVSWVMDVMRAGHGR